jgi:hypothetical protein
VVAVARPLAAWAYEKTGGAGVGFSVGLVGVELILENIVVLKLGYRILLSEADRLVFTHYVRT